MGWERCVCCGQGCLRGELRALGGAYKSQRGAKMEVGVESDASGRCETPLKVVRDLPVVSSTSLGPSSQISCQRGFPAGVR